MTSGEQEPEHGRHRHGTGTWTPEVQHLHAPAHARPEPEVPAEITVPGLRKFDLGSIPASVTPPRSWRRAAWFAVGASMLVVFGLIFAASTLMGRSRNPGGIDALPGFPSMPLLLETPSETGVGSTPKPTSSKRPPDQQQQRSSLMSSPPRRPAASGTTTVTPVTPSSERPTSEAPPPPPVRETTPPRMFALNDPKEIGDRTEAYYKQVTTNPSAAYKMTTGDMYLQGEDAFKRRYAGIRSVQVRRMSIDPNQGTTVSEVKITKTDGSTITEVRKLRFTSGSNPKISSEVTH